MGAPDKTVKTDEGRATTTPTTDNRRVSFMAMPITTSGQRTSSPNAAEEAEFSKVYEIFTPADVLDKNFKDQSTDMDDDEFKDIWNSDRYWQVMNHLSGPNFNAQRMCGSLCLQHKTNEFLDKFVQNSFPNEMLNVSKEPAHVNFI